MKRSIFLAIILILAVSTCALATGWPQMQGAPGKSFKVTYRAYNNSLAAIAKGACVIIQDTSSVALDNYSVTTTTATSSVLIFGVADDTIAVATVGNIVIYGVTDVLVDTGGCTALQTFGTNSTATGEAGAGQTHGGILLETKVGRGLVKGLVRPY